MAGHHLRRDLSCLLLEAVADLAHDVRDDLGFGQHPHLTAKTLDPFLGVEIVEVNGEVQSFDLVDTHSGAPPRLRIAVNDYEGQMLQERTGISLEKIARRVQALVVTRGAQGSTIYRNGQALTIPPAQAASVVDPTGCGDAYRAGLIYGITRQLDWETTGRIASLMGAVKVAHSGTQNHDFGDASLEELFRAAFGRTL